MRGTTRLAVAAVLATYLRDVLLRPRETRNFRLFGPDETASNRLSRVFEATDRASMATTFAYAEHLAPGGRVMEILSEHTGQGCLEGYLLTGRHGLFSCYEAFIHIVDSMLNQHAKWLKACREIPWRRPISRGEHVERVSDSTGSETALIRDKLIDHKAYIRAHGDDLPEVKDWRWPAQ